MNDLVSLLTHPWWFLIALISLSFGPKLLVRVLSLAYGPEDREKRDEMVANFEKEAQDRKRWERPLLALEALEPAVLEGLGGRIMRRRGRARGHLSPLSPSLVSDTRLDYTDANTVAILDYFRAAGDFRFDRFIAEFLKRRPRCIAEHVDFDLDDEECASLVLTPTWTEKDMDRVGRRRRPVSLDIKAQWGAGHWHREPRRADGRVSNMLVCHRQHCDRAWSAELQAELDALATPRT